MSVMKKIQGVVAGVFLSAALFIAPGYADAMEIQKFDQMSENDQGRYVSVLFGQSVRYFWGQGEKEKGDVVLGLFKRNSPDETSEGMKELVDVLGGLREMERQHPEKVPHVEHAMSIVLRRHGVSIPFNDFMQFAKDFQPQDESFANNKAPSKPRAALDDANAPVLARK